MAIVLPALFVLIFGLFALFVVFFKQNFLEILTKEQLMFLLHFAGSLLALFACYSLSKFYLKKIANVFEQKILDLHLVFITVALVFESLYRYH